MTTSTASTQGERESQRERERESPENERTDRDSGIVLLACLNLHHLDDPLRDHSAEECTDRTRAVGTPQRVLVQLYEMGLRDRSAAHRSQPILVVLDEAHLTALLRDDRSGTHAAHMALQHYSSAGHLSLANFLSNGSGTCFGYGSSTCCICHALGFLPRRNLGGHRELACFLFRFTCGTLFNLMSRARACVCVCRKGQA